MRAGATRSAPSPDLPAEVERFQRDWHFELFDKAWSLFEQGQGRKALELAAEAMRIKPDAARSWVGYGVMLRETGDVERAIASFRRALLLRPDHAGAWSQLGEALRRRHRLQAAELCHHRALALQPEAAVLHHRHAATLVAAGRDEAALPVLDRALALDPAMTDAQRLHAECRGRLGDLGAGWGGTAYRPAAALRSEAPAWRGEPLDGRTLLVLAEQGHGDPLWIARHFEAAARGGRLVVRCRRELHRLFEVMDAIDAVADAKAPLPDQDLHVTAAALAAMFAEPGQVPTAPYLQADPADAPKFARWLGLGGERLKVGLVWAGSAYPADADARALPLPALVEAFDLPGVQLYALQKSSPSDALSRLQPGLEPSSVIDLGPLLEDFADTAAVLAGLDLLITVDTAAAHLAGALGRPAWLLLNSPAHWLWGRIGERTPWYPSLRLFRAPRPDAWDAPLDQATVSLMALASEKAGLQAPRRRATR